MTRENAVKLKRNEYFIADLIGMRVENEDGSELGTLQDVIATGANDVYVCEAFRRQTGSDPRDPGMYPFR